MLSVPIVFNSRYFISFHSVDEMISYFATYSKLPHISLAILKINDFAVDAALFLDVGPVVHVDGFPMILSICGTLFKFN